MSRQPPSDHFTRFTSNTPHANNPSASTFTSSNPTNFRASSQNTSAIPPNETPAEKVARLRAQHAKNRAEAALSRTDRIIARGRVIADATHKVATYSLVAFTGVAAVVAAFSLVSLITHNRRQKRAWIEREMDRLHQAQQAFLRGEADAEQLHLLEQERAGEEMARKYKEEKERTKRDGYWSRLKETLGTMTGSGDKGVESNITVPSITTLSAATSTVKDAGDKLLNEGWVERGSEHGAKDSRILKNVAVQESAIKGVGLDEKGRPVPINKVEVVKQKFEDARRSGEKEVTAITGIRGGPLDVIAENATSRLAGSGGSSSSWTSWITGGSK